MNPEEQTPKTPDEQQDTSTPEQGTTPAANEPESTPSSTATVGEQEVAADALTRTPEELEEEQAKKNSSNEEAAAETPEKKKFSRVKTFFRKVNVYFLLFLLLVIIASIIAAVNYLNSKKPPYEASIATQELDQEALKQLANSDATVGNTSQTLTIQGNAIIEGQTLMRGDLNVAGNFQTGGSIQGPSLTISGTSNLGETQINSLQVAANTAVQGSTTLRDLNVAGSSSFSGPITAAQMTVTRLIMSGNGVLEIPNHISFTGPTPGRSVNSGVLGAGGSVSVSGSDTAGVVNISTGNNPSPGCFTQITFYQRFTNQPRVVITPIGSAAGRTQFYVDRDQGSFSICTANAAPANQSFAFDYFVTN